MMLYKNTKAILCSRDGDNEFFDTPTGENALTTYLFIIYLDYAFRMSIDLIKQNGFTFKEKKATSRRYPVETITKADNADDLALLANTPAEAGLLLHSLAQAAEDICTYVNANKIIYEDH